VFRRLINQYTEERPTYKQFATNPILHIDKNWGLKKAHNKYLSVLSEDIYTFKGGPLIWSDLCSLEDYEKNMCFMTTVKSSALCMIMFYDHQFFRYEK
jgi:hypothetical protein